MLLITIASGIWLISGLTQGLPRSTLIGRSIITGIGTLISVSSIIGTFKILRTYIVIDDEGLSGRNNRELIRFLWKDVNAAELESHPTHPRINFYRSEFQTSIPVFVFHKEKLWNECKRHLPSEALTEAGKEKIAGYKQWADERRLLVQNPTTLLKVQLRHYQILGVISLLFWIGLSILTSKSPGLGLGICATPFIFLSLFLLAAGGTIQMNSQQIQYAPRFFKFAMRWDEITHIEMDVGFSSIVFANSHKRLPISGSEYWSGTDKSAMQEYLSAQIHARKIPVRYTARAYFSWPKNTRITNSK